MADKQRGAMPDDELATLLDGRKAQTVGFADSRLTREYRRVLQFYDAELPGRTKRGQSSYVSQDVFNAVESAHAQLLEVFSGPQDTVRFGPATALDTDIAAAVTEAVHYDINCKNQGYRIFSDVIKDGLMFRFGCAKAWWEDTEETDDEEYGEPMPQEALGALADQPDVSEVQQSDEPDAHDQETGEPLYKATVRRKRPGYAKVDTVPLSELLVSRRARTPETADLIIHRVKKTRAQLRELGLTDDDIDEMVGSDAEELNTDIDDQLFGRIDGDSPFMDEETRRERHQLWVDENYTPGDFDGSGEEGLWKVVKCGPHILDKERVKCLPLFFFVASRRPHSFWGNNWAQRSEGTQINKTVLTRSVVDHAAVANNPRQMVVRGTLQNPAELNDDRLGGIINVNRIDGIAPLVQPPLNPYVFQTLQMLDYNMEDNTGVSRLSQGLNKDALSNQNSAALVETLQNAGQMRMKIVARNFALTFLVPLYEYVAKLIAENAGDTGFQYVSGGKVGTVPAKAFSVKRDLIPELHLGYGEAEAEAKKYLALDQLFSQQPSLQTMYGPQQKYRTIAKALRLGGIRDVESYLAPPDKVPPPQPSPMEQAELQLKQADAQLKQAEVQLKTLEIKVKIQQMHAELQLKTREQGAKETYEATKLSLEERKVSLAEFEGHAEVAAMQQAENTAAFKAIAAPRG